MSGPKVVRVVTREEVEALCRGHLAQLDAALDEWGRIGRRNDCVGEDEIAAAQARRDAIRRLLAQDRLMDLQKQAPQEIAFLRSDIDRRLGIVAAAAAEARSAERRRKQGAQAILGALHKAEIPVPEELERALSGGEDPAALSRAWALLGERAGLERSEQRAKEQQAIASLYGEGLERRSLDSWVASQAMPPPDPARASLDQKISELKLIAPEAGNEFEKRIAGLEQQQDAPRRSLLIDSLNLDLSRALSQSRKRQRAASDLALLLAELATIDAQGAEVFRARAESVMPEGMAALVSEAREALELARANQAAAQRRQTILTNLATLGYEVTEGMSTAWVDQGQLVVRNAARPDYGVEVGGNMSTGRLQMRVVAFADEATPTDQARDRDAETLWCGEVDALKENLKAAGGEIVIERAHAVGATPVKRVADPMGAGHRRSQDISAPQSKAAG